jgi:hypothetical protein
MCKYLVHLRYFRYTVAGCCIIDNHTTVVTRHLNLAFRLSHRVLPPNLTISNPEVYAVHSYSDPTNPCPQGLTAPPRSRLTSRLQYRAKLSLSQTGIRKRLISATMDHALMRGAWLWFTAGVAARYPKWASQVGVRVSGIEMTGCGGQAREEL